MFNFNTSKGKKINSRWSHNLGLRKNLPEDKQQKAKAEIQGLAKEVTYEELEPLFGTAVKKAGTRIATMIALKVLLNNGLEKNAAITEFIEKALEDNNELLVAEAKENA